ncbi:transcriptional regulator [Corynebacterium sp. FDAARGOS 1242]|uniref:helix-turn-helix domain-containing protein n=1 Tax=Corynebacterium sp. FDAARGOS 1242 TaxID=2778078 RepID=UPI00195040D3|nr:helix-turn-helix domain-containing protein [Corynebacterium sp. FDAARGOS 1242]QRP98978.1 transcriptional regulator [Corynebacterium sp. FDAARGOS 1242]
MIRLDPEALDRARQVLGASSDYALAEALGRTPACVSNWRRGRNAPGLQDLVRLQKITGIPYGKLLLIPESV